MPIEMSAIHRCPYCGSSDVYTGPFETYCADCGESWPNEFEDDDSDDEQEFINNGNSAMKFVRSLKRYRPVIDAVLGGSPLVQGKKFIAECAKHIMTDPIKL